jgi:hypothetical protein
MDAPRPQPQADCSEQPKTSSNEVFFAIAIDATPEPSLLARIAQRLSWIGVELDHFSFAATRSGDAVHIEALFETVPERAELLAAHMRKLVSVSRVKLSTAYVRRVR